jgi:hypothetical protein
MEEWKEVIDFPGYYISNFGNLKSKRFPNKLLKPNILNNGYYQHKFFKDDKCYTFKTSRLVAKHFLEEFDDKLQVDHIDRNKINNHISNLRMVTRSQNNINRRGYGKSKYKGVTFNERKKRWEVIVCNGRFWKRRFGSYETEEEAAKVYNEKLKELGLMNEFTILNEIKV